MSAAVALPPHWLSYFGVSVRFGTTALVSAGGFILLVQFLSRSHGLHAAYAVVIVATYLYLAIVSVMLAAIDISTHRLPNDIVLPLIVVLISAFTLATVLGGPQASAHRAGICGAILFCVFFGMRTLPGQGMGGGDVKLAGALGMSTGWVGWDAFAVGSTVPFVFGGVAAAILLLRRRGSGQTRIAFGPYLLAGAWTGISVAVL